MEVYPIHLRKKRGKDPKDVFKQREEALRAQFDTLLRDLDALRSHPFCQPSKKEPK